MGNSVDSRRIIGLTGGIATGKSTVASYLAEAHGLPVLDADLYAREAVSPGSSILRSLKERYGPAICLEDGQLNRRRLGEIIFNQPEQKRWVEQQIHPFVRQRFAQVTDQYPPHQTLVYAIPLLFEAGLTHLVTEVWVVVCSTAQQQQRLMARNQLSLPEAEARIQSQLPLGQKVALADAVLDNGKTREWLYQQTDRLLQLHD